MIRCLGMRELEGGFLWPRSCGATRTTSCPGYQNLLKAEEAQTVEADEDGAAFVADDAERQGEMEPERADDEHDDDAEGERQVLEDHGAGAAAERERERNSVERVAPQHHLGGFRGA